MIQIQHKTFNQVYEDYDDFYTDYLGMPLTMQVIDTDSLITLYVLLVGRYGNSRIANLDITQFKYKLFGTIFQYGGTWEKKVDIQKAIRQLSLDEVKKGATNIYNRALNPEVEPSTQTTEELTYINEQNVQKFLKNDSQAYMEWMGILEEDVTEYFLEKFRYLFQTFVGNYYGVVNPQEEDESEGNE